MVREGDTQNKMTLHFRLQYRLLVFSIMDFLRLKLPFREVTEGLKSYICQKKEKKEKPDYYWRHPPTSLAYVRVTRL